LLVLSITWIGSLLPSKSGCSRLFRCMFHSEVEAQDSIPTPALQGGIWYDPDRIVLEGNYSDQITAYRAKRRWTRAFESNFLLEGNHDFKLSVAQTIESGEFCLKCDFLTACGRYAFWRLTHNQAPEVQFLLETAHIPSVVSFPSMKTALPELDDDLFDDIEPSVLARRLRSENRTILTQVVDRCVRWLRGRLQH
jgi:hypothetical protein